MHPQHVDVTRVRVRWVTFLVTIAALLLGIVASTWDRQWAILAAAVIFGWTKTGDV